MGIMDIIKGGSKEDKLIERQLQNAETDQALSFGSRSNDWASAGQESQVNLYIVSNNRKFLKYKPVKIKNESGVEEVVFVKDEKYNFVEPYNDDDPLSFSDPELRIVINEFGRALGDIYEYVYKYTDDEDEIRTLVADFNMIVRLRNDVLANTRTTGQSVKAAKSQSVSSTANIIRHQEDKKKPFGLL
ncbi:MAG TPA: hypothetical protein PKN54_07670 [Candidatus Cloacimonas acidaminovorans]|nr:hypothetical protein [Candidatus Cloacimonas acidaminovorans]